MPINLSNVNISLRQFQEISEGKYNAGEVRLTSDHTLGKVNYTYQFTVTGLGSGKPQIASVDFGQTITARDDIQRNRAHRPARHEQFRFHERIGGEKLKVERLKVERAGRSPRSARPAGSSSRVSRFASILSLSFLVLSATACAQSGYTNHAGNVVAGWPVKLTQTKVTLAERAPANPAPSTTQPLNSSSVTYPLSIFPESEQRRIAADFGQPRIPPAVKRAISGAEKAMARSRRRAEKGLCTKEESDAFCAKSAAALKSYLDRQVESGVITPAERKALNR